MDPGEGGGRSPRKNRVYNGNTSGHSFFDGTRYPLVALFAPLSIYIYRVKNMKVVCESVSRPPLNFSLVHPRPTGGREILMENKGKFVTGYVTLFFREYISLGVVLFMRL